MAAAAAKGLGISMSGISSWFERLTDREKKLVVGFAIALFVILVGGGFYFLYAKGNASRQEMDAMQQFSIQIENLRPAYLSARAKNEALEAKARRNVDLTKRIQDAVRDAGLSIQTLSAKELSAKDRSRTIKGKGVKEERMELVLSFANPMSVDRLTTFLSTLEGDESGGVVKVMSISIKPSLRPTMTDLLDVTNILVSTFKQG